MREWSFCSRATATTACAISDYNAAIKINPRDSRYYSGRGECCYKMGDLDKAIADYSEAILIDPKDSACFHARADAYARKREWEKAIADYGAAIGINP